MAGIWDYETASSRRSSRLSGRGWTRKAHFENVPADGIEEFLPTEGSVWPGEDDDNSASRLYRADVAIGLREDIKIVDLLYRPQVWMEWLINNPNHAVLYQNSRMISRPMKYDHDGNIMLGPDPTDATGRTQWELVEGTGLEEDYLAIVEVVGVVDIENLYAAYYQYVSEVGSWNNVTITKFPKAGVGVWRLAYLSAEPIANVGRLWNIRMVFDYNPDEWSTETKSRKMVLETREMPVYDADGEVGGEAAVGTKRVTLLVPSPEELYRYGGLTKNANFIAVDTLLTDSWA